MEMLEKETRKYGYENDLITMHACIIHAKLICKTKNITKCNNSSRANKKKKAPDAGTLSI